MEKNYTRNRARIGMFIPGTELKQHFFRAFFLSLLLIGLRPSLTHAENGIFQSYILLNRGWGNEYYAGGSNADGAPAFDGSNFGSFWSGQSFTLNGGEVKTYKNNG